MSEPVAGRPAVVLLSGGLDSATCLAIAKREGYALHAISFRYGQRHGYELECARRLSGQMGVASHRVVDINLAQFGGSALTDGDIAVPKSDSVESLPSGIPVTYVPARNTVFLSLALALAETLDARDLFVGVNALDYSGYPDCRPEFIEAFERLANLATRIGVEQPGAIRVHAPLLHWSKAQIIARGLELGVDYSLTNSCYDPLEGGAACGRCDACLLRRRGFEQNGLEDPSTP
ncbi:7-cyano-7-deazaguanine synthase QueC [Roseimaritima sediminicola]|uniref:7-cyano-7-deazaguanine synthase QueC n=1 Tax=Roseimaritima sediminicola TaxID=2662066 RepID=UPI0012983BA4|nr:7-cyano-7-deazaguanine synthase QueC [Roseimaritima sediminicola]